MIMKTKSLSNAEAALLGLLAEGPKHPYQIEKDVEYRDMRSWTDLSMSSIYKLLQKLEGKEMVSAETELAEGNRARKTYQITAEGRKALEVKIRSLLRKPVLQKDPFYVGMYNSDFVLQDEVIDSLAFYRESVVEQIDGYRRLEQFLVDHQCSRARLSVAIRPRYLLEAELTWLEAYLSELKTDHGSPEGGNG